MKTKILGLLCALVAGTAFSAETEECVVKAKYIDKGVLQPLYETVSSYEKPQWLLSVKVQETYRLGDTKNCQIAKKSTVYLRIQNEQYLSNITQNQPIYLKSLVERDAMGGTFYVWKLMHQVKESGSFIKKNTDFYALITKRYTYSEDDEYVTLEIPQENKKSLLDKWLGEEVTITGGYVVDLKESENGGKFELDKTSLIVFDVKAREE